MKQLRSRSTSGRKSPIDELLGEYLSQQKPNVEEEKQEKPLWEVKPMYGMDYRWID